MGRLKIERIGERAKAKKERGFKKMSIDVDCSYQGKDIESEFQR